MRCILVALALMGYVLSAHAGQYILYMNSEPGDWIGGGKEYTYTDDDIDFVAQTNYDNGVSLRMNNFSNGYPDYIWWYADFAAPYRQPLSVGTYEAATRFPFQADYEPGLSISGQGAGCNRLTGRFQVLEIRYDDNESVERFAVDFEQHCEGRDPALYGSIRYNSDVPISTLLPPKITLEHDLNDERCVEAEGPSGTEVALAASSAQDDGQFVYEWSTDRGEVGSGTSFSLPIDVDETVLVQASVTDPSTSRTRTTAMPVCVSDTVAPSITILNPSDGDVFVGDNMILEVSVTDTVDREIDTYDVVVGKSASLPLVDGHGWQRLAKPGGDGAAVSIEVSAEDASGNMGSASVEVEFRHDMR